MSGNGDDYLVGYGKPPVHSRFRPGESGNRKGRPKGAGNFKTDLDRLLKAKVTINRDGRVKKVTTQVAALLRLVERALKGDPRALLYVLELAQRRSDERETRSAERHLSANEKDILARFVADIRNQSIGDDTSEAEGD